MGSSSTGVIQLAYSVNRVKQGCVFVFYAPPPALQEKFQEKDQDDDDDDKSQVHSYVSYSVKICAQSKVILI